VLFVYRTLKKNHDAMTRVNKQSVDLFRKFGVRLEPFQLTSTEANDGLYQHSQDCLC
jgi:hypothetical protein